LVSKDSSGALVIEVAKDIEDRLQHCLLRVRNFLEQYYTTSSSPPSKRKRKSPITYTPTVVGVGNAIMAMTKEPLSDMKPEERCKTVESEEGSQ